MRLGLSQRTVETYVRRLFTKLDVNSRSQIVLVHESREYGSVTSARTCIIENNPGINC
ncbi:hypothetical protein CJ199_01760 [Brevibacterium paucivorans]|uniref:HTH luxR-type domain-containing protein n=1 Tax=Brevibacterium paucivorans TaxID=170994 RepID=A0A2N6VPS8_9MICO|nr:hypothetical protein CJ199_01760 [Brevibacterium paucivorans]